jgi:hypothetical protein
LPDNLPKEGSLSLVGFQKIDVQARCDGQNKTRKSAPGAKVNRARPAVWQKVYKLQRILEMAMPQMLGATGRN